jgi:hypothetical protein
LISKVAGAEFGCEPQLDYGAEGFRYRFDAPLAQLGAMIAESPLRRNLRHATVRALYDSWTQLRGVGSALPALSGFDWKRFAATGALTVAQVHADDSVRFIQVGQALTAALGRGIEAKDLEDNDPYSLAEAYCRCSRQGDPTHELLRFDFGDGTPLTFERLLVPFSAPDGETATHVIGIAIFEGQLRAGGPAND